MATGCARRSGSARARVAANGCATFETMEHWLRVGVQGDGRGHFLAKCEARNQPGTTLFASSWAAVLQGRPATVSTPHELSRTHLPAALVPSEGADHRAFPRPPQPSCFPDFAGEAGAYGARHDAAKRPCRSRMAATRRSAGRSRRRPRAPATRSATRVERPQELGAPQGRRGATSEQPSPRTPRPRRSSPR